MFDSIRHLWDVGVLTRDSVRLSVDIYLPPAEIKGPYPGILIRTPYDNSKESFVNFAEFFARHGYAFVAQDVRGRGDSDGDWRPYPSLDDGPDGYDTIEWIAGQPWSNGKIGTMGGSYSGEVQWVAARGQPPHLVTMVSTAASGRWMQETPFVNGIPNLWGLAWLNLTGGRTLQNNAATNWKDVFYHLPLKTMDEALGRTNTVWRERFLHPDLDDFWKCRRLDNDFKNIDLPVLHITGWFDGDQPGALYYYEGMVNHSPAADRQFILIGPWDHAGTRLPKQELGGVKFPPEVVVDMNEVHLRWFDYWLKGIDNGLLNDKRARIFTMGENKWHDEDSWPLKRTVATKFYLHSAERANTLGGDGRLSAKVPTNEPPDRYTYNPENPVITLMNWNKYGNRDAEEPLDKRFIERRDDVLVYTSEPLQAELGVCGRPFVRLYASSDCLDTDWIAMLSDVYPDDRSISLGEGVLRARYRNSLEKAELMIPGKVYEFTFELMSTCNVFHSGHRIRLTLTSSGFPIHARNPNTGHPIGEDAELRVAHQTIYHCDEYPSHLLLPVV